MITYDIALLDSNILVYAHQSLSAFHESAKALRDKGLNGEIGICVCPQVLMEFYAVITDPKRVTSPVEPREAMRELEKYLMADKIMKIYPNRDLMLRILDLLAKYEMRRHEVFYVQIVATMLSNNVKKLYTYNHKHFERFKEIEVMIPYET
ncbi:TPA: PIN domain-containing protein [bacterium]|nr:PIN domain-containing protein [bacterium]